MQKWQRKVRRDSTHFQISIPLKLVKGMGWENVDHVQLTMFGDRQLLIGRCDNGKVDKCDPER